ncbi:dual specificity protein phosphatase 3-like [Oppia nitens]|uniref:dual specificity protein phosphatase 3-like n=1 Tax=Oppia nitens TaxID=1686743 RepID=UPI0023DA8060|nr:dual specificity protein phosphatase 3-like [Oppia nitens]
MKRVPIPYKRTMAIRYSDPGVIDEKIVQLQRVIVNTQTNRNRQLPGYQLMTNPLDKQIPLTNDRLYSGIDCDEVYPNLFIGNEASVRNKAYLKMIGVTHVVNCAEGTGFTMVSTGRAYYADVGIQYIGINVLDVPHARISGHFHECANFIDKALKEGGRVIVHCFVGLSRSATIALSYLMIKKNMNAEEALRTVKRNREIRPNDGFLRQLLALESKLYKN